MMEMVLKVCWFLLRRWTRLAGSYIGRTCPCGDFQENKGELKMVLLRGELTIVAEQADSKWISCSEFFSGEDFGSATYTPDSTTFPWETVVSGGFRDLGTNGLPSLKFHWG